MRRPLLRPLASALLLALPALAFAQGALTPPGAPAPSMKSLDQVEPRTPLADGSPGLSREANGGFTITAPGSYYLTGNVSVTSGDAIAIDASGVTLDLGGFTISSRAAGTDGSGITTASGTARITIRHGFIAGGVTSATAGFSGAGLRHGLYATGSENVVVEDVTVQGLVGDGINLLGGSGVIRSCAARLCGGVGLRANQVLDSQARQCGATAIFAGTAPDDSQGNPVADGVATNCYGESVAGSPGVFATTATNCIGKSDSGAGVSAKTATNCQGQSLTGPGVSSTTAAGCTGTSSSSTGLTASTATDCYGYSYYGWGLFAEEATGCHGKSEQGARGLHAANTATGCTGEIVSATGPDDGSSCGLHAGNAINCQGIIGAATSRGDTSGIEATNVSNSHGSAPGAGICCTNAHNSTGTGKIYGIKAEGTAENCRGTADGDWAIGLLAETATSCIGQNSSYIGLSATTATSCTGITSSGDIALFVTGAATNCRGKNPKAGGKAISAIIAVSCTSDGGTIDAIHKYNMP